MVTVIRTFYQRQNYKVIGSKEITKIKLMDYNGYKTDGVSLSDHELHDAVGINIQFTNGEFSRIRKLILFKNGVATAGR